MRTSLPSGAAVGVGVCLLLCCGVTNATLTTAGAAAGPSGLQINFNSVADSASIGDGYMIVQDLHPTFSWQLPISYDAASTLRVQIWKVNNTSFLTAKFPVAKGGHSVAWDATKPSLMPATKYEAMFALCKDPACEDPAMGTEVVKFFTALPDHVWQGSEWIAGTKKSDHLFRTSFVAPAAVPNGTAYLFVSGVGASIPYLNGRKLNENILDPGTTSFADQSLYVIEDVTGILKRGDKNTIAVMLGNGWYGMKDGFDKMPKLRVLLLIDGVAHGVTTPHSWKVAPGPILNSSIYNGETYDSSKEVPGWENVGFDDSHWQGAKRANANFSPRLYARDFMPIRINETLDVQKSWSPAPGITVYEFPHEVSGFCEITVTGTHGSVMLHHGEILNHYVPGKEHFVYFKNLDSAKALDTFILNRTHTTATYRYRPHFTYHGFRFVQVNHTGDAKITSIKALAFFSAVPSIANFASSSRTLNTLHQHVLWGQSANLMSYPSDCDNRDERMGWMADGWLTSSEASGNFAMHSFYRAWLRTITVDAIPLHSIYNLAADVSPYIQGRGGQPGDPAWGLALPFVARLMNDLYGDIDAMAASFNHTLGWWKYLKMRIETDGAAWGDIYSYYGDWLPPPPAKRVSGQYTSGFAYLYTTQLVIEMGVALGVDVSEVEAQLAMDLPKFKAKWYNTSNATASGMAWVPASATLQSTLVYPMMLHGLVDTATSMELLSLVEGADYHLNTGIISLRFLFPALTQLAEDAVALRIITQPTYPGWAWEWSGLNETKATTLWERWDAPDHGPGMDSRNHIMDGSVDHWVQQHVGGIQMAARAQHPGEAKPWLIRADVAGMATPVTHAAYSTQTPRGLIATEWRRTGGTLCAEEYTGHPIVLDCGSDGGVVDAIEFASAGDPHGICTNYHADRACHADAVLPLLEGQCLGRQRCSLDHWWDHRSVLAQLSPACAKSRRMVAVVRARCSQPWRHHLSVDVPHTGVVIHVPKAGIHQPTLRYGSSSTITTAQPMAAQELRVPYADKAFFAFRVARPGRHSFIVEGAAPEAVKSDSGVLQCRQRGHELLVFRSASGMSLQELGLAKAACLGQAACVLPTTVQGANVVALCGSPTQSIPFIASMESHSKDVQWRRRKTF